MKPILAFLSIAFSIATGLFAEDIPFQGEFKVPELKTVWQALNSAGVDGFKMEWQDFDPSKDNQLPENFWKLLSDPPHHITLWVFQIGIGMPPEQFLLKSLYREGQLYYPYATHKQLTDYRTFYDLHHSLAWLYSWKSSANPLYKSRPLRMRAQQLALIHLVGMTQYAPGPPMMGGWPIQYGNPLAWNADTLRWLDQVEPVDPELKKAWLACLDHILNQLEALGPDGLQTPMGHWNLWPLVGAFSVYQVSNQPGHRALFEKWAAVQLQPDAFTSGARYWTGVSPVGYYRYSGVDFGYNGQAKHWVAPLFYALGTDSVVGDYVRRQYRIASYLSLEEPDGSLTAPQHMNSHALGTVASGEWGCHHTVYAGDVPDAVPFARREGYNPGATGGKAKLVEALRQGPVAMTVGEPPLKYTARGYPSDYLNLPYPVAYYPVRHATDIATRTRPHEHLAYARWFQSPVVRDEFFVRRKPSYHFTLYSGPCAEAGSNYDSTLSGMGAGGLSQLWIQDVGTVLRATTDFNPKYKADADFGVWSQLPINALVGATSSRIRCTGWTGSLMTADPSGSEIIVKDGVNPGVSTGTPMTGTIRWERRFTFQDREIQVHLNARTRVVKSFAKLYEILPIAWFEDRKGKPDEIRVTATTGAGATIPGPWDGPQPIKEVHIRRGGDAGLDIILPEVLPCSFGKTTAETMPLQVDVTPRWKECAMELSYTLRVVGPATPSAQVVRNAGMLPKASPGKPYSIVLEADGAPAVHWAVEGELPPGLSLNKNGLLSGTPTKAGTFHFNLRGANPYHGRPFFEKDYSASGVVIQVQ